MFNPGAAGGGCLTLCPTEGELQHRDVEDGGMCRELLAGSRVQEVSEAVRFVQGGSREGSGSILAIRPSAAQKLRVFFLRHNDAPQPDVPVCLAPHTERSSRPGSQSESSGGGDALRNEKSSCNHNKEIRTEERRGQTGWSRERMQHSPPPPRP